MARFQRTLDEAAFEAVFSATYRPALAVARQLLPDVELAEDAVQTTFLKIVRRRASYDSRRPFEPWFYRILRNTCRDALRRGAARPEITGIPHAAGTDQDTDPGNEAVADALARVPAPQRAVLELRIVHEMRFAEIGEALGITEEAAKKRGQRGLRALREAYETDPDIAGTTGAS